MAGWVEVGWISEPSVKVTAKLDTGAETSSINAPRYREFDNGGQRYVSFEFVDNDGDELVIKAPVVRIARIRRAGVGKRDRLVIRLKVCVAGVTREAEFTLADRSGLAYPVLIGRNILAGSIHVDSGNKLLWSGGCAKP